VKTLHSIRPTYNLTLEDVAHAMSSLGYSKSDAEDLRDFFLRAKAEGYATVVVHPGLWNKIIKMVETPRSTRDPVQLLHEMIDQRQMANLGPWEGDDTEVRVFGYPRPPLEHRFTRRIFDEALMEIERNRTRFGMMPLQNEK
jgi:hypothetical protein